MSLKTNKEFADKNDVPKIYISLGVAYAELGGAISDKKLASENYNKSMSCFKTILEIEAQTQNKSSIAMSYSNLSKLSIILKKYNEAVKFAEKSLDLGIELGNLLYQESSYGNLAEAYDSMRNYQKAYYNHKLYKEIGDSIYNIASSKQIKEMEAKYQNEKTKKEITILNEKAKVQELTIEKEKEKKRNQLLIFGGLIIIIVFISLFFINRYRMKQKEILLHEKLQNKKEQLHAVIDAQEKERTRFARDVHDGIGQYFSALKFKISNIESRENLSELQKDVEFTDIIKHIDDLYQEIRNISFNIMPQIITMKGLIAATEELAIKINALHDINVELNVYGLEERLANHLEVALYRIVQELLNNIIKYAHASQVNVQFTKRENTLNLMIEDNGMGYDTAILMNSEGHGWKNIKSRIELIHGTIDVDSIEGKVGSTVIINIPLAMDNG